MFARAHVIAHVHQRDRVIVVLFWSLELGSRRPLQLMVAGVEVHRGAVRQFFAGTSEHFLKMRLRFVELVLLHGAQTGFIALQRLRIAGIFWNRFLCRRLLSHVQNSSCTFWNKRLLVIKLWTRTIKYHSNSGSRAIRGTNTVLLFVNAGVLIGERGFPLSIPNLAQADETGEACNETSPSYRVDNTG